MVRSKKQECTRGGFWQLHLSCDEPAWTSQVSLAMVNNGDDDDDDDDDDKECSTKTIKRSSCWSSSRQEIVVSGKPLPPVFLSGEPGDKTEYTLRSAWTSSFTPLSSSSSSLDLSDTNDRHIYVTFNNSPWVGLVPVHNIHLLDEITIIIVLCHHLHNPREIASW